MNVVNWLCILLRKECVNAIDILAFKSGLRVACAALLAFIFYQFFDVTYGYWAVVSVAAVMQMTWRLSLRKSCLRLLGTLLGLCMAYVAVRLIQHYPMALLLIFPCGMFLAALIIFAHKDVAYIGIVCGISFIFIVSMYHLDPQQLRQIMFDRTIDIIFGLSIACVCFYGMFPRKTLIAAPVISVPRTLQWHGKAALIMAVATTLSLIPWFHWHYAGGVWAPIACLFIVEENINKARQKAKARFYAHVVVMLIAVGLSFLLKNVYGVGLALFLGMFFFGMWIEKPLWGFDAGLANTMAIAFCVILLLDPTTAGIYSTMLARVANTVVGILAGLIVVHLINRYFPHFFSVSLKES